MPLLALLGILGLGWRVFSPTAIQPPEAPAPARGPLPDFRQETNTQARKAGFFKYMLPRVQAQNERLATMRTRLKLIQKHLQKGKALTVRDQAWLRQVQKEFRLEDHSVQDSGFWKEAFLRVDTVDEDLVLVQAALESAWGTSRFAREGNNLFGQWCFQPGCGMVPQGRNPGDEHEVARFPDVTRAVASYLRNLNTGSAYARFRAIRAGLRAQGKRPTAQDLIQGLEGYSQRREEYIRDLSAMLRTNESLLQKIKSAGPDQPEA